MQKWKERYEWSALGVMHIALSLKLNNQNNKWPRVWRISSHGIRNWLVDGGSSNWLHRYDVSNGCNCRTELLACWRARTSLLYDIHFEDIVNWTRFLVVIVIIDWCFMIARNKVPLLYTTTESVCREVLTSHWLMLMCLQTYFSLLEHSVKYHTLISWYWWECHMLNNRYVCGEGDTVSHLLLVTDMGHENILIVH